MHLFVFLMSGEKNSPPTLPESFKEIYSIEKGEPGGNSQPRNKNKAKRKYIPAKSLSLSGQGGRMGIYQVDPNAQVFTGGGNFKAVELGTEAGVSDGKGGRWAVPLGALKYSGVLSQLHEYIDNSLIYPREFVENGIEGTVKANLYFDKDGVYLREESRFQSYSNYVNVWFKKNLRRIFKHKLHFPTGGTPLKVAVVFELELGSSVMLANSSKGEHQRIAGGKLYFYRKASKNYGMGFTGPIEGTKLNFIPYVEVFSFLDRIQRVLDLSTEEKQEKNMLEILRDDPEWGRD